MENTCIARKGQEIGLSRSCMLFLGLVSIMTTLAALASVAHSQRLFQSTRLLSKIAIHDEARLPLESRICEPLSVDSVQATKTRPAVPAQTVG